MAKVDKERLAAGFWNRKESNQTTDCYRRTISFDGAHFVEENKSFIKDSPDVSIVC